MFCGIFCISFLLLVTLLRHLPYDVAAVVELAVEAVAA